MDFYLYLISIAFMGVLTQTYFRQRKQYKDNAKALTVKASCTFIPVLLCFYALILKNSSSEKWLLFAGVFLCMVADVVIGIHFVGGMLTFLVAHLFFIAYYLTLAPFNGISLVIFIVLCAGVVKLFWRYIPSFGSRLVPFAVYSAVLALMFSIAFMLPWSLKNTGAVCIAVGAGLFVLSDSLLAGNTFGAVTVMKDHLVMYLYYPAVYLLAISAFYM